MRLICLSRGVNRSDGWGRVAYEILSILAKSADQVIAFVPRNAGNEAIDGLEVRRVLRGKKWGALKVLNVIRDVLAIGRVRADDVIIAFDEPGVLAAWILAWWSRARFITVLHGTYAVTLLRGPHAWLYRHAYHRASCVLFVSRYTRSRFVKLFPDCRAPLNILPLGVDRRLVADEAPQFALRKREVLLVGEVKPRKGLHQTIQAVAQIPPDRRPTVVVAGRQSATNAYVRTAIELAKRLDVRLTLLGHVTNDALEQLYRRVAAFVLPSQNIGDHFEGFGLVHLEAAARGLPAIGSKDCGNEEAIVDGKTGHLCAQDDVSDLAACIDRLVSDEAHWQRCSAEAVRWARSLPWSRTAEVLLTAATARR